MTKSSHRPSDRPVRSHRHGAHRQGAPSDDAAPGSTGSKATIAAFLANIGVAFAKFVAFAFTGSASMLAEGVHSVADSGNQGLLLWGRRRARKAPTAEHPFGFGRERYFWAFVVALVLFTGGSLFSLLEGEEKLRQPHEVGSWPWAAGVLVIAAVMESLSLRTAYRESLKRKQPERSWFQFVRRTKTPELPVVLLEDTGALAGLLLAFVGVSLAALTGDARFDAIGSLSIGLLLGTIALTLAVEMKSFLIGESASSTMLADICQSLADARGLGRIVDLRTEHLGPDDLLVVASIEMTAPAETVTDALANAEEQLRARVPEARLVYLEPVNPR